MSGYATSQDLAGRHGIEFCGLSERGKRTLAKFLARAVMLTLAFSIAVVIGWTLIYPSESDPKNIKYVLWKSGLRGMNLDAATDTMIGDTGREKLVVGETKSQLQERFGYLSRPAEVSPYLRGCFLDSAWKDRDVLFIRKSAWMVVFDGDKARELILIKGC